MLQAAVSTACLLLCRCICIMPAGSAGLVELLAELLKSFWNQHPSAYVFLAVLLCIAAAGSAGLGELLADLQEQQGNVSVCCTLSSL
jgi:hypothetical protein